MSKKLDFKIEKKTRVPFGAEKWIGRTGLKRLTIDIDPALHAKLKKMAAVHGMSMRSMLTAFIKTQVTRLPSSEVV